MIMYPKNIGQFFRMQSPITPMGTIAPWKIAGAAGLAGGALLTYATLSNPGQNQQQKGAQSQGANPSAGGTTVYPHASEGGIINIYETGAKATSEQEQKLQQQAQQVDLGGLGTLLIIAVIGLGAITLLRK